MAEDFGSDFQLFMVRLEVLHLRLTRWGEAVGLNKPAKDNKAPSTNALTSESRRVGGLLTEIETRFQNAVDVIEDLDLEKGATASETDYGDMKSLILGKRDMLFKRHPRTNIKGKANWVIYQKEKLESLIETFSKLVNDLHHVPPADPAILKRLCKDEISQLFDNEHLHQPYIAVLEAAAEKLDERLAAAVAQHKTKVSVGLAPTVHITY